MDREGACQSTRQPERRIMAEKAYKDQACYPLKTSHIDTNEDKAPKIKSRMMLSDASTSLYTRMTSTEKDEWSMNMRLGGRRDEPEGSHSGGVNICMEYLDSPTEPILQINSRPGDQKSRSSLGPQVKVIRRR